MLGTSVEAQSEEGGGANAVSELERLKRDFLPKSLAFHISLAKQVLF